MNTFYEELVTKFNEAFGHPVGTANIDDPEELELRVNLIVEEFNEFIDAVTAFDEAPDVDTLLELMKELGDLQYVISGFAVAFGLPLDEVVEEIHKSNMTKLDEFGKPIYREDGKILKGPLYEPPDLSKFIEVREEVI